MDTRVQSEEYAEIGARVIEEEDSLIDLRNSNATIVYLTSEQEKTDKGRKVCAECEKVPEKYKWSIPADYTITVFLPNIEGFTEEQKRILIFHELLHINITYDKSNAEVYGIKGHDYEDFKEITDRYGTEWNIPKNELRMLSNELKVKGD